MNESELDNSAIIGTSNVCNTMTARDEGANKDIINVGKRHDGEENLGTLRDVSLTVGNVNGINSEEPTVSNKEKQNNDGGLDDSDGKSGDNNHNSAERAIVIRREINTDRLKKSGLHLQIAQALLKKVVQKEQLEGQNSIKPPEQKEQENTIQLATIKTLTTKVSSPLTGVALTAKKPSDLTSLTSKASTVLSVPKITITSPPCDTKPETLRDDKNNRLEDVKRILNRQILMRKLSNTEGSTISVPLNSSKQRLKIEKTTLQLPPHTIVKTVKKLESTHSTIPTVSMKKSPNVSGVIKPKKTLPPITVRKFHTITSPQVIMKPTSPNYTLSSKISIPVVNVAPIKDSAATVRVLTKQGFQSLPTSPKTPSESSSNLTLKLTSSTIQSKKAIIHSKVASPSTATPNQLSEFVTIQPIASISKEHATVSHQLPSQIASPKCSSSSSAGDISSHTHISTATITSHYKVFHTISTPKPKIFEIHCDKRLKEDEQEKTKSSYEQAYKRLRLSESIATVSAIPITNTIHKCFEAPKPADSIINALKEQPIETENKRDKVSIDTNSKPLLKTENLPIVLENKLLQPDEQIDLKGLCLNRIKFSDRNKRIENTVINSHKEQQKSFKPICPSKKSDSHIKTLENRKMHIIISNEKLKSPKLDMAALAKQVLQRATKKVSDEEGHSNQNINQNVKRKPKISKASINLLNKQSTSPALSPQKVILRKKILDLCGIKDDTHLSPVREYPETVEIIEECDTSEYDDAGTTAVDFIASLAMTDFGEKTSSITAAASIENADKFNHDGVQLHADIVTNVHEVPVEIELQSKSLGDGTVKGLISTIEKNVAGEEIVSESNDKIKTIDEDEITSETIKEIIKTIPDADELNHDGVKPQPDIVTCVHEVPGEVELQSKSLGDGIVKGLIFTIENNIAGEEIVSESNDKIKTIDEDKNRVQTKKEMIQFLSGAEQIYHDSVQSQPDTEINEETLNENALKNNKDTEKFEESLKESKPIESSNILTSLNKVSILSNTTVIDEKLAPSDNLNSSAKNKLKTEIESKSLIDANIMTKEISAELKETTDVQKLKVVDSEKAEDTDKNSATKTVGRKRIGIRNVPINLVARKKSAPKKPIKSKKKPPEEIKTTPETYEYVFAEDEKTTNLEGRGDGRITSEMKAEESVALNKSQQEILLESLETSRNIKTNEEDNKEIKNILELGSVSENTPNSTEILVNSIDSSRTPNSSDVYKESDDNFNQKHFSTDSPNILDRTDLSKESDNDCNKNSQEKLNSIDSSNVVNIIEVPKECDNEYDRKKLKGSSASADTRNTTTLKSVQINSESSKSDNKDDCKKTEKTPLDAHGIKILATAPIANSLQSNLECSLQQRKLFEVGAIIDVTACGIDQSFEKEIETKIPKAVACEDIFIGGNNETCRSRFRKTKRVARILTSSDSEPEINYPLPSCSSKSYKFITAPDEISNSTSDGSDLFGFAAQQTEFEEENEDVKNVEDECSNTMELSSSNRGSNVPPKKRWDLSNKQQTSQDNDMNIDDTSPVVDDDTMDNEEIGNKSMEHHNDQEEDLKSNSSSNFKLSELISKPTMSLSDPTQGSKNETKSLKEIKNTMSSSMKIKRTREQISRKRRRVRIEKSILCDSADDSKLNIETYAESKILINTPLTSTPLPKRRGRPLKKTKVFDSRECECLEPKSKDDDNISGLATSNTALKKKLCQNHPPLKAPECSIIEESGNLNDSSENQLPTSGRKRGRKPKQTKRCSAVEVTETKSLDVETPKEVLPHAMDETSSMKKRGRKKEQKSLSSMQTPPYIVNETMKLDQSSIIAADDSVSVRAKKKLGRKSLETSVTLNTEYTTNEEVIDSSTPMAPKKRGRKAHVVVATDTEEVQKDISQEINRNDETNEALKKKRQCIVGDFNPRLLLIRQREQLETEEVLTVAENERGDGPLQCGLCLIRTTQLNWSKHLAEHYGIGWMMDKQPPIDITTRSTVLSRMIAYFKKTGKKTLLPCRLCLRLYKSPLGLLLHLESCGHTIRVECPLCGQQYTKLSFIVHQRTCQKNKKNANEAVDEQVKVDDAKESVISNSGRFKRAAQIRAENKLKNLTSDLSSNEPKFEPKDFIKCTEDQTDGREFQCTKCYNSFTTEADAIKHVVHQHKSKRKFSKSFEADESDCDGNNEVDYENRESATESSMDSDSDDLASPNKKLKSRKAIFENKRPGSLLMVYPRRERDVPKLVLKKWKQFIGSNYTMETLYPYAMPIYSDEEHTSAKEKMATELKSMKFAFSDDRVHFKALGSAENNYKWQELRRFESMDQKSTDKLICLGTPIKTLAWVPLTENISEQYLVVSCRKSMNSFTRQSKPKQQDACLLIYKIETLKNESDEENEDFHANIHYVLHIPNGPVHTMAFLPSGGYDAAANRLGVLAIGTATSDVEVFALPIQPERFEEIKIGAIDETLRVLRLKAAFKLVVEANSADAPTEHPLSIPQCSHICWSEFSGHQHIIASYVHGYIAIWDIKEPADPFYNLNCHMQDGKRLFTPLNYFYFGEKIINSFAVHYDTNGVRWLAAMGSARKHIVYDVRNLTNPITVKEEFLRNVPRNVDWNPVWESYAAAFCDTIPNHGHCVLAINPVSIIYTHSRMEYMLCGVSTVHYNPWQSICCVGADNGDIIYVNTREMHHDLQVLFRASSNVMVVSELDINRLDGEEIVRLKLNDNPQNWQMYEKDYKEKYGLVFSNVSKFKNSDRKAYLNEQRIPPRNLERYMRINTLRWNLNCLGKHYIAIGYENGFLRLMRFKREAFFE